MRTIKIILGFISIITVIFFTTGLLIKETSYTTEVTVNKPVDEVFSAFNNIENTKKWIPEIKSIDTIQSNFVKTGSIYQIVINNQGEDITMTEKVMAYIPNEKLTVFYDAENMLKTNDYTFTENDGATKITLRATCVSESYMMACVFPYFKSTFKEQDQAYLNNFKQFIEQ